MRKPKILVALLGMDQHELGAITVSKALRDGGVEVVYAGRFNLPAMIMNAAAQEDIDVIGLSCYSWEYLYYVPELLKMLRDKGLEIPVIVGGGIITPKDADTLKNKGVRAVFGPGSSNEDIVTTVNGLARS